MCLDSSPPLISPGRISVHILDRQPASKLVELVVNLKELLRTFYHDGLSTISYGRVYLVPRLAGLSDSVEKLSSKFDFANARV